MAKINYAQALIPAIEHMERGLSDGILLVMHPSRYVDLLTSLEWPYYIGVPTTGREVFGCKVVVDPSVPEGTVIVRGETRVVLITDDKEVQS